MAKIKDILSIRLENDIKSVIDLNQQDEHSIIDELDGFIQRALPSIWQTSATSSPQTLPNRDCG